VREIEVSHTDTLGGHDARFRACQISRFGFAFQLDTFFIESAHIVVKVEEIPHAKGKREQVYRFRLDRNFPKVVARLYGGTRNDSSHYLGMEPSNREPTAPHHDRGRGGVALVIIDVINRFDFDGGEELRKEAQRIIDPILALRDAADAANAPVIYVNDNFGEWHSEKSRLIARARPFGGELVARLAPRECDFFVIKPQLSAFYATNFPLLLPKLGVSRLILTGIAAEMCVLFTAGDAHMRDYALWIPEDAVASSTEARLNHALDIARPLGAETAPTSQLKFSDWTAALDERAAERDGTAARA
jgi:nicotinamidase-related amidase